MNTEDKKRCVWVCVWGGCGGGAPLGHGHKRNWRTWPYQDSSLFAATPHPTPIPPNQGRCPFLYKVVIPSLSTASQRQGKFLRSALFEPLKFVSCPWRSFKLTDVISFWDALCVCPGIKPPPASQLGKLLLRSVSAEPALWFQPAMGVFKTDYTGTQFNKEWIHVYV